MPEALIQPATTSDHLKISQLFNLADERSKNLYPGEDRSGASIDSLLAAGARLYIAGDEERLVGCGGYNIVLSGIAELIRLFVIPAARGQGVGTRILTVIERNAALEGATRCRLETGRKSTEAIGLYAKCGYRMCLPFGQYAKVTSSIFMEKVIG